MFVSCSDRGAPRAGKRRRQGFVLLTTAAMVLLVLLPSIGLAVDAGMMYLAQTLLSAACDASSLAGARDLARGADDNTQRANAVTTANTFFYSNFPSGYFILIIQRGRCPVSVDVVNISGVHAGIVKSSLHTSGGAFMAGRRHCHMKGVTRRPVTGNLPVNPGSSFKGKGQFL